MPAVRRRAVTPRAEPFTITAGGGAIRWRFFDQRDVEEQDFAAFEVAQQRRNRHLRRFYENIPAYDGVDLCELDMRTIEAIQDRFKAARQADPDLLWDDFELAGGTLVHDGCQDPRKRMLNFLVRDLNANRWIGGIHLGNIEVERDDDGNLTARAFFWAGLPVPNGFTRAQVWVRVMRYLIQNDITLRNGRVVDIVGFDFLGEPWFRWRKSLNPDLVQILSGLTADVTEEDDLSDSDIIRRIRRRGA